MSASAQLPQLWSPLQQKANTQQQVFVHLAQAKKDQLLEAARAAASALAAEALAPPPRPPVDPDAPPLPAGDGADSDSGLSWSTSPRHGRAADTAQSVAAAGAVSARAAWCCLHVYKSVDSGSCCLMAVCELFAVYRCSMHVQQLSMVAMSVSNGRRLLSAGGSDERQPPAAPRHETRMADDDAAPAHQTLEQIASAQWWAPQPAPPQLPPPDAAAGGDMVVQAAQRRDPEDGAAQCG